MYRATTPTHIFTLPFETGLLKTLQITYCQFDRIILQKGKEDCTLTGKTVKLGLTQQETLLFQADTEVSVQLRLVTADGKALASDIAQLTPKACLCEEVLE